MLHDPRTNPRPGDVVKPTVGNARTRHVEGIGIERIRYWSRTQSDRPGKVRWTWLWNWQDWCRKTKAIVVKRGD
jgi:hypothetical protein